MTNTRNATADDAMQALLTQTTITPDQAARVVGQSGYTVRLAIERGDIASMRLGRNIRVLSAPLRRQLGLEEV
ncbi:hypothetical protein [Agromyces italicus]|uniref:hypothetical protein n=1 Tax=Agromyces italicus TaxID=279572 RepID=UPI0003B75446|nr:hypothetical protein [Agromyces italicus]